ncbi:MAG: OmpH family outer membrane protein [Acidobacteria bacterium]|nr:OmpH family outer membrane protein [Acidobacteriota bacterium]
MRRIIIAVTISAIFSMAATAQTPAPPKRPATNPPSASSTPSGGTGAEGKVAILYSAQFRQGIGEFKTRLDALSVELEPKKKEIEALEAEIKNLKNKIQTQNTTVTPQIRSQWDEEATLKDKLIKRKTEDFNQLGQKRFMEVSEPIYEKIRKSIESYCQQNGIVLVVEGGAAGQAGILIWADQAIDITSDFMAQYNKANPGSSSK